MAGITINGNDIKEVRLNGQNVTQISDGTNILWKKRTLIGSPLRVVNNVAGSEITVTLTRNGSPADIDMEYSTDNVNWHTWTETNGVRSMSIAKNGNLYLRGNNPNGLNPTDSDSDYYSFTADKKYAMAGDIRSLISRYEIDEIPNSAFRRLFAGSTTLDNASFMRLPAKKPGNRAYLHLFDGCTGLVLAPHELPATNLVNENNSDGQIYGFMFKNCSSLTTMPIIKATRFGQASCFEMFMGCSALTKQWTSTDPTVTTTTNISFTIADDNGRVGSFYGMFENCTSLVDASGITATKTTDWNVSVFNAMFNGCTALTSTPTITIGSFASGTGHHCNSMFRDCTSLTTVNMQLNATTLYTGAYKVMFYGCTSLTTAPEIKATSISGDGGGNGALADMFNGCTKLTYIKVNFTDWNNGNYTQNWTRGLPSSGRFDCPSGLAHTKNASGNTSNANYIPYNWGINQDKLAEPTVSCVDNVVTMSCSTSGATIKYSTDGGTTYSVYSTPITISETTTYTVYATKSGMFDSDTITYTATYVAPPKLNTATVVRTGGRDYYYNSYATLKFSTTGVSGVTYYVNYSSIDSSSVTNPTTTNYNYKLEGKGANSEVSQEFGGNSYTRVYIKVLSVKSGYTNSDIKSANFRTGS